MNKKNMLSDILTFALSPLTLAYHLSLPKTLKVAVIEKDPRYVYASAMLSVLHLM
jgi:hypothetical protein